MLSFRRFPQVGSNSLSPLCTKTMRQICFRKMRQICFRKMRQICSSKKSILSLHRNLFFQLSLTGKCLLSIYANIEVMLQEVYTCFITFPTDVNVCFQVDMVILWLYLTNIGLLHSKVTFLTGVLLWKAQRCWEWSQLKHNFNVFWLLYQNFHFIFNLWLKV